MKKSAHKTGKVGAVFFTALVANCIVAGLYVYIFFHIQHKNVHIAELSQTIEAETARQDALKKNKEKVSETAPEREKLDHYAIGKDGVVAFLNSLQSLGALNRLSVKLNSVGIEPSPVSPDIFEVVKVSLEASGSWSDTYRFAALSELMPLKVSVRRVDLQKNSADSSLTGKEKKSSSGDTPWKLILDLGILKFK